MQKTPLFHRRRPHAGLAAALIAAVMTPAGFALRGAVADETALRSAGKVAAAANEAEPRVAGAYLRPPAATDAAVEYGLPAAEANRWFAEVVLGQPSAAAEEPAAVKVTLRLPRPTPPPRRAAEVTRLPKVAADELPPWEPPVEMPPRMHGIPFEMIESNRGPAEIGDTAAAPSESASGDDGGENAAAAEGQWDSSDDGEPAGFTHPDGGLDVHRLAPSRFAAPLPGSAAGAGSG